MTSNAWSRHFSDMVRGEIPYSRHFYKLKSQTGMGDIQLVTPTQADVQRAKSDMKRKLIEADTYKPKRLRVGSQLGSGQKKKRNNSKSKKIKKKTKKGNKSNKSKKSKTKKNSSKNIKRKS